MRDPKTHAKILAKRSKAARHASALFMLMLDRFKTDNYPEEEA